MIMVSCFDYSCVMAMPWAEAGVTCYCVDLQHPPGETVEGNIIKVGADVWEWMPPHEEVVFAAFFPPCTDVAVSGARWFKDKGIGALINALKMFQVSVSMGEAFGCPYIIENPVSTVSTYWRKPDYIFDPCDFGEKYTKKTCLWVGGDFVMPMRNYVVPYYGSMMHEVSPSNKRQRIRSETPRGFSDAVFKANSMRLTNDNM